MKNLLICLVLLFVTASGWSQAANQVFTADTTHGNENVYFTGSKDASIYQGIAGFVFTTSHDVATFYLQGCYNTSAWYNIDTVAASGATAVNQELFQTPPRYKYYRLWGDGNAGDTCYISNVRYYLKY
jgi:hypothetical protein